MILGEKGLPLVSVMVPVYNCEKYISRCLNSIINQTYRNLEIIIIDDGSTDKSGKIADEYSEKDCRIHVIHQENSGLASSRNRALAEAKGEYLMFIDADDYLHLHMIDSLYNDIRNNEADMAIGSYLEGGENEFPHIKLSAASDCYFGKDKFKELFGSKKISFICAWGRLYSRNLFDNLKYPDGKIHEDEYLAHYLLDRAKKITYTQTPFYYYFKEKNGKNSITQSSFSMKRLDCIAALEDRLEFFKNYGDNTFLSMMYDDFLKRFQYYYYGVHYQFPDKKELACELFDKYKKIFNEGKALLNPVKRFRYALFLYLPSLNYRLKIIMKSKSIKT